MPKMEISNIQRVILLIFHTILLHCMSFGHLVHFITQFTQFNFFLQFNVLSHKNNTNYYPFL